MADTGFSDGADSGEKVNLFEQLENSDIDDDENNSAMDELFFNAAADEADEFSGVAFANSVTGKDFEDEVVFGGGITEDLEDAFDGGDEFDGAGIVKSNSKKQSATSEIGDAAKRFAGNDGDEEKEQIWPALVVFVVCLIFIILLCIFGIEMFKSGKDTKPSGDATNVPFVTQTPSGDSTDISSETPIETGTPAETETPSTDAPVSTNPPVINTDDVTMAPTETPTAEPTEAPASDVPETETPETETPATDVPASELPETEAPATDVPETDVPVTDIPATDIPETEIPATDTPTEEPPAPTEVPSEEPSPESSADPADVGEGT
jgi:cytoskeletal protein RodZ